MSSIDNLTDGEIRVKLTELGYPVGPITATTRKVLLKKLKYLLEQSKLVGNEKNEVKSTTSLSRYSSEEESEGDVSTISRNRPRRSMPPPPPKNTQTTIKRRSLSRRTQDRLSDDINLEDDPPELGLLSPSASSTLNCSDLGIGPLSYNSNEKYSPKSILSTNNRPTSFTRHSSGKNRPSSPETMGLGLNAFNRSVNNPQDDFDTGSDTDGLDGLDKITQPSSGKVSTRYSTYMANPSNRPTLQTRSHFTNTIGEGSRFASRSSASTDVHSSPFSSDFVRRLSAASSNKSSGGLPSRLLDVKESDDEDISQTPTFSHQNTSFRKRTPSFEGRLWKNATTISMVLLFFVAVFFCGLAAMYLTVRFKESPISPSDTNYPICKLGEKPGSTCILSNEVQPAMNMFSEIYQVLNDRAVQLACGHSLPSSALTEGQITQIIVDKSQLSVWDIEKHFGNIKVLIRANPQWGVEVKEKSFDIPKPVLPLGCYIMSFLYGIIGSAVRLIFVAGSLLALIRGIYWWIDQQERNKKEVFKMVESIIDILSSHQQSSAGDNYLAINHVRDQLIPPQHRDNMANIWNKAVAYLEENESRVRTEVQQVLGEEFRVWRWLSAPRTNGKRKVWQGQAFETMEGSVNSLPVSPTPCLKIRHMFDSDVEVGDDWMIRVQDAVLEKCEGVNVLHVAVDKNSNEGCVYVKCASAQDAGCAYRALHGSWFDSKLVTVKYLRLERYHERFPEAARTRLPLRPSNDRKLSLQ